jgi:hypothetical protein
MERLPLWTLLVGAAALSGAYEYTYAAAPPEIASTSVTAVTSLLVASAVGFLVVALTTPRGDLPAPVRPDRTDRQDDDTNNTLDDMMEKSQ